MKRFTFLSIAFLLVFSLLAGCNQQEDFNFDWDGSIQTLQEKGLVIDQTFTTEAELTDANRLFNEQHRVRGGKVSLEIKRAVVMLMHGDLGNNCQIIEFANKKQAEDYTKYYIATRDKDNIHRIATDGSYVVITTLEIVKETLNIDFK